MREKELIRQIKRLRTIKPQKDWVLLCRRQILGDYETRPRSFWAFQWQQALVLPVLAVILIGGIIFVVSQSEVPKDFLYSYIGSVKQIDNALQRQAENEPELYLSLAEQKIKELKEVAKSDEKEALAFVIEETKEAIKKAAENIPETSESPAQTSKYIEQVNKIQTEKREIDELLGEVDLGDEELENRVLACITNSIEEAEKEMTPLAEMVKGEIEDWDERTLTPSEREALNEAEGLYAEGDYSQALERLLDSSK